MVLSFSKYMWKQAGQLWSHLTSWQETNLCHQEKANFWKSVNPFNTKSIKHFLCPISSSATVMSAGMHDENRHWLKGIVISCCLTLVWCRESAESSTVDLWMACYASCSSWQLDRCLRQTWTVAMAIILSMFLYCCVIGRQHVRCLYIYVFAFHWCICSGVWGDTLSWY